MQKGDENIMVKTTRAQREALLKLYNRGPIFVTRQDAIKGKRQSYKEFRKTVMLGEYIMVPWAGMVIGIEKDGYTHS